MHPKPQTLESGSADPERARGRCYGRDHARRTVPSDGVDRTGEGVIVLSNRPASPDDATTERAAPGPIPSALEPVASDRSASDSAVTRATSAASDKSDAHTGLWGGLALVVLIIVAAALVAWERRRRAAAHYAALLAHSEPRPPTSTDSAMPTGSPPARAAEASAPRSVRPPSSGVNTPPASERQWLSQPPPRGSKDPPV
jgi:hypothetical protein